MQLAGRRLMGKDDGQIVDAYDEDAELDRYVWFHHADLFTHFELAVQSAHRAEFKASHASERMGRVLRERWGAGSDAAIAAALAGGWPVFRSSARARVMRDHADEVVVNRCPSCLRVVKTPLARQCLWCGHDWHDR